MAFMFYWEVLAKVYKLHLFIYNVDVKYICKIKFAKMYTAQVEFLLLLCYKLLDKDNSSLLLFHEHHLKTASLTIVYF